MKFKNILSVILLSFTFTVSAQKKVMTEVSKAVVFSQGAQIERNASINFTTGENVIRFVNLERSINANTIQVYGSEDVTIVSTDYILKDRDDDYLPKDVVAIKDDIEDLDRKIAFSSNRMENYRKEKAMILENKNVKAANEGLIIEDLMDLAEYYREQLNVIDSLLFEEQISFNKFNKEKRKLTEDLKDVGFTGNMGVIEVKIISSKTTKANLKVTYIVNGVSWTPFYDIKSDGMGEKLSVALKGTITQNTGVNWEGVSLSLSTSTPMQYGVIPEVHPWTLYFRAQYNKKRNVDYRFGGGNQQVLSNGAYDLSQSRTETGSYSTLADFTKVTESMTNREFDVSIPYNIKGYNGKAVVEIDRFEMTADYVYYTAPKFDKNVYLLANVDEWEQFNLLPGTANVFLKGTYMGNSFIDPSEVADTLSLLLGKDIDVTVDRKKVKDYCKKSFVGGKKTTELGLEVIVQNKKNKDIHLIVEDQVPISKTEDIEVKILDKSRAKHEDETGKLTWDYTLKAGETNKHLIRYEVKYPKNQVIDNL